MSPGLNSSIRQRLLDAEAEFLAVRDDGGHLEFMSRWGPLCDDIEEAFIAQELDDSICSLARAVAFRVATLGEDLIRLRQEEQEMTAIFIGEVDALFSKLSLSDVPTPARVTATRRVRERTARPRRRPSPSTLRLPFYPLAYDWLLRNIHDPYPSKVLKGSFAASANIKPHLIDSWFKAIRKEIGWDVLRRKYFKGSRNFTSAAALRCFVEDSQDLPFEIAAGLRAMQRKAEALFSSPCSPSSSHQRSTSTSSITTVGSDTSTTTRSSHGRASPYLSRPPSLVFSASDSDEEELPVSGSSSQESLVTFRYQERPSCVTLSESVEYDQLTNGSYGRFQRSQQTFPDTSIDNNIFRHAFGDEVTTAIRPSITDDGASQSVTVSVDIAPSSLRPHGSAQDLLHSVTSIPSQASGIHSRKRPRSDANSSPPSKRCKMDGPPQPQVVSSPLPRCTNPQPSDAADFQTLLSDQLDQTIDPMPNISQYIDFTLIDDACFSGVPPYEQTIADLLASDSRLLSEIVEDAPSSTTLKLLPLPNINASSLVAYPASMVPSDGDVVHPSEPVVLDTLADRELPPIHWSSSSLAGALGPIDQEHAAPPTPPKLRTTLENPPLDVLAPPETRELEPHNSNSSSLQAILPGLSRVDCLKEEASSSISSRLEDVKSNEHTCLQQLLDLLGSPSYAAGWWSEPCASAC